MNILYCFADLPYEWNCSEWRCAIPQRAIDSLKDHTATLLFIGDWAEGKGNSEELSMNADLIIAQRNVIGMAMETMYKYRALGKKVIIDLDDDYRNMMPLHGSYDFWRRGILNAGDGKQIDLISIPADQLVWSLKLSSGLSSPSKVLLDDWKKVLPNLRTFHVPNCPELDHFKPHERHDGPLVIGWGGSVSHLVSWMHSGVTEALMKVLSERKDVSLKMYAGHPRMYQDIQRRFPGRVEAIPLIPHNDWFESVSTFDIGIAPLWGAYDRRRSNIKVLEYMLSGVPWIATDYEPYHDFAEYGALVKNERSAWYKAIMQAIENYDDLYKKARENIIVGESYSISNNIESIIKIYQEV